MNAIETNAENLKNNLPHHFEAMAQKLGDFADAEDNDATMQDFWDFKEGNYLVRIEVDDDNNVNYSAGRDQTNLNEQQSWFNDPLENYPENEVKALQELGLDVN